MDADILVERIPIVSALEKATPYICCATTKPYFLICLEKIPVSYAIKYKQFKIIALYDMQKRLSSILSTNSPLSR